jgi:RNA polymerase sigma factor (sigma-70 family)
MEQMVFSEFYEASRDACLRAVLASVADRGLAEDLVAEAYARAWASWPAVRRHPAPRAWIVRTALNTGVSWWRRQRKEVLVASSAEHADTVQLSAVDATGIDPALLRTLCVLPRRQREVIALRVFLDLDTRQTARVLGIAEGTVTAHLARAIATLRAELVQQAQEASR